MSIPWGMQGHVLSGPSLLILLFLSLPPTPTPLARESYLGAPKLSCSHDIRSTSFCHGSPLPLLPLLKTLLIKTWFLFHLHEKSFPKPFSPVPFTPLGKVRYHFSVPIS